MHIYILNWKNNVQKERCVYMNDMQARQKQLKLERRLVMVCLVVALLLLGVIIKKWI